MMEEGGEDEIYEMPEEGEGEMMEGQMDGADDPDAE